MLQNAQQRGGTAGGSREHNNTSPAGISRSYSLGRPNAFKPQPSPILTERKPSAQDLSSIRDHVSTPRTLDGSTHPHHSRASGVDYRPKGQDRLSSLFQKARAKTPHAQSHSVGPASPQDGLSNTSKSSTTPQDEKAAMRQEHLQRLRERAEKARLELMAFELMESENELPEQHPSLPMAREKECVQHSPVAANRPRAGLALHARKLLQASTRLETLPQGSQSAPERAQTRPAGGRPQTLTLDRNAGRASRTSKPLATKQTKETDLWMSGDYKFASSAEQSPSSPGSTPSPPVSPIAAANLAAEIYRATCGEVSSNSFLKAEQQDTRRSSNGRKGSTVNRGLPVSVEHSDNDEDDSDRFLQNHLDNCEEDLRDITLSEMFNRQLGLSSDESDGLYNSEFNSPSNGAEVPAAADMTFADRTGIFMLAHQEVPSLLAETIPEADLADMTFMTCPDDTADMNKREPLSYQEAQALPQLPPMVMPRESILDEFLKTLPPLPQSPVDLRWPSERAHLRSGQSPIPNGRFARPSPMSPQQRSERSRPSPVPTPIITSQERCQQILQGLTKRVDRFHSSLTSTSASRPSSNSPDVRSSRSSPRTSTLDSATPTKRPLISIPTPDARSFQQADSEASTPASVYNSAREDFTYGSVSNLADVASRYERGEATENRDRNTRMRERDESRQRHHYSSSLSTHESSAASSPWTALSPASSTASDSSAGSSWTVGSM
ncbi:hypothetical protein EMPS_03181 [Entomortierella parvispora]|uniref:Uncharacterized protein n=1 Tax=Entomortierella parvispora TaxID=205924 RepID=A0A9P3H687_9FUNG|nr:hypothetical protein EMPS_03181 [Entomortierella parvispora]